MALNVAVIDGRPSPFAGEIFVLERPSMAMELSDTGRTRGDPPWLPKCVSGVLFLTNYRMVILSSAAPGPNTVQSVELPMSGIISESFNQPIFGSNNLTGECRPYDDAPVRGAIAFKLKFLQGGASVFLTKFNEVLLATRRAARAAEANPATAHAPVMAPPDTLSSAVASGTVGNTAFVDPSDPTTLYMSQPEVPYQPQAPTQTLRRRRP